MNSERWQQVEEVLQAALDRPPQERLAVLDEMCAGDEGLRNEATSLLDAYDNSGDFIEEPAIAQDAHVLLSDQPEFNVGYVVGPYRIVERLGSGGMGEVYLAQDTRLGRLVALKILLDYFASDDSRLRRFQREARAASALNHPNILTIHEVGEVDSVHFIATEFIDGETLRELMSQRHLSLEEILNITIQVASALATAHVEGIVHRDIKPENIMRRSDGLVKILDFGIAKLTEPSLSDSSDATARSTRAQTDTGVVMGTVGYMSPEQARGLGVDERTDIWSLGVVVYEMLAGRAPFAGATRVDTLVEVLEREPVLMFPLTSEMPAQLQGLQDIVTRSLRKERDDRYRTISELLVELRRVQGEIADDVSFDGQAALNSLHSVREKSNGEVSANASSVSELPATYDLTRQPGRNALKVLIVIMLLMVVVTGTILYRRSVERRKSAIASSVDATTKLYAQMSEAEQLAFIVQQEQNISAQMGDRPAKLNEVAQRIIKAHVDDYVRRSGSFSAAAGQEDLRAIYARPLPHIPLIARSFAARKVPVIIGIYLPMIESEYKPCFENESGAKGLYQFMPQTAIHYGVAPEEMCDVKKMTPAAAHYIADRMAELGDDAESMTLVLLSYNTGPEWVRDTLRQLRDTDNYERNFWTLLINRDKLGETFRGEKENYVPRFFAAAIIGENPQAFGLQIPPLSSLAVAGAPASP